MFTFQGNPTDFRSCYLSPYSWSHVFFWRWRPLVSGRVVGNLSVTHLSGSSVSAARQKQTRLRLPRLGERTVLRSVIPGHRALRPAEWRSVRPLSGCLSALLSLSSSAATGELGAERRHIERSGDVRRLRQPDVRWISGRKAKREICYLTITIQ